MEDDLLALVRMGAQTIYTHFGPSEKRNGRIWIPCLGNKKLVPLLQLERPFTTKCAMGLEDESFTVVVRPVHSCKR